MKLEYLGILDKGEYEHPNNREILFRKAVVKIVKPLYKYALQDEHTRNVTLLLSPHSPKERKLKKVIPIMKRVTNIFVTPNGNGLQLYTGHIGSIGNSIGDPETLIAIDHAPFVGVTTFDTSKQVLTCHPMIPLLFGIIQLHVSYILSIDDDEKFGEIFFNDVNRFIKMMTRSQYGEDVEIVPNLKTTNVKIKSLKKSNSKEYNDTDDDAYDFVDMVADMIAITHFCSYGINEVSINGMSSNSSLNASKEYDNALTVLNTFMPYIDSISVKSDAGVLTRTINEDNGTHTLKRDLFLVALTSPHLFRV